MPIGSTAHIFTERTDSMKATGIVRRIDDYVIIRPSRNPSAAFHMILSEILIQVARRDGENKLKS